MAHVTACVQTIRFFFPVTYFLSLVCLKMYLHDSVPLALLNTVRFPISFFMTNTDEEKDIVGRGQSETEIKKERAERRRGGEVELLHLMS